MAVSCWVPPGARVAVAGVTNTLTRVVATVVEPEQAARPTPNVSAKTRASPRTLILVIMYIPTGIGGTSTIVRCDPVAAPTERGGSRSATRRVEHLDRRMLAGQLNVDVASGLTSFPMTGTRGCGEKMWPQQKRRRLEFVARLSRE